MPPTLTHLSTGEFVSAADWNANVDAILAMYSEASNTGILQRAQTFRGLHLRTHPDADRAPNAVALLGVDEIVLDDGARYTNVPTPLVADITAAGAGGLDTGTRAVSTWYEAYVIGKSATRAAADSRLMLHRAKDYFLDTSMVVAFDISRALRLATGTATDKLAQGFRTGTTGKVESVDVTVTRVGAVTGNIWFTIEGDTAGNPSGAAIATSDKLDASKYSTTANYSKFVFRTPPTLTSGTQYHLVLQGDYARSDTVNVIWSGTVANNYANGSARQYNGSAWTAATGLTDFQFKVYVTRNETSVAMPAGYDEKAKVGYVYNQGTNVLWPFLAKDRVVRFIPQAIITAQTNTSPVLGDISIVVPPGQVEFWLQVGGSVAASTVTISGVPDGYFTSPVGFVNGNVANTLTVGTTNGPVLTEYQAFYYYLLSGSGNFSIAPSAFRW